MPGVGPLSAEDAAKLVAFLRGAAPTAALDAGSGDPVRGRDIFRSGGCLNCHRVNGEGGRLGPDLSRIGAPPVFAGGFGAEPPPDISPEDRLELALLEPNAEVSDGNRTFQVVTRDQTTLRGRLMSHDTFTLSLLDADGDRLVTFRKAELESFGMIDSPMPSYRDRLDASQLADVISYLLSLRGPGRR
jgi:mono/diheme cytochrome c family protein